MLITRSACVALVALASIASAVNAQVILPVNLNGGIGARLATSVLPVDVAPSYNWSLDLTSMAAGGLTGMIFGFPSAMPLYGSAPGDLIAAGSYNGSVPGNLLTRNFTFTDLGSPVATYDFTVSLDLLADRTVQTSVTVVGLGSFMPGGIIPMNPISVPVSAVNVGGMATVTAIPAPGSAALAALGGLVALRRRRCPIAI